MKNLLKIGALMAVMLGASMAHAGTDSGLYLGGSIGTTDADYDDLNLSDDDSGYKVYGGYNFGIIPLIDLAAELSYIDFGSYSDLGASADADAYSLSGIAALTFGPFGVFGKAGYFSWDSDFKGLANGSDSGSDPMYGVGAKFALGSLAVRAEYEMFDLDDADIDFLSVGLTYTF